MVLFDVTVPLREGMFLFPGDPDFTLRPFQQIDQGDPYNLSLLSLGSHVGTHVDPPRHYLAGETGVDRLPLESLIGPGVVLDLRGRKYIDRRALEEAGLRRDHQRVLFQTDNSGLWKETEFNPDFVYLTLEGAELLAAQGVKLVGHDYLSIEEYGRAGAPVHRCLLKAGVVILEGVDLSLVPAGEYEIICLPLRIQDGDGAPARVVLRS